MTTASCVASFAQAKLAKNREFFERKAAHALYLYSPEWRCRRGEVLEAAGYRCQVCNGGGRLEVHHRVYRGDGKEQAGDLIVLCRACHGLFHRHGRLA